MDSYELGLITGKILFWLLVFALLWAIKVFYNKLKIKLFSNPTRELLKTYLFWVDFVQGIKTTEEFKKRLKKIQSHKVYKDEFERFYLSHEEAEAQNKTVEAISIKEVLSSQTYPLFLAHRLERITLYSNGDLKNIKKSSYMVWTSMKDIIFHMIIDKDKVVYPKDYPKNNRFRFGYEIFYSKDGLAGLYDVEDESLVLPFNYTSITNFANIAEVSKDGKTFEIYDLETNETLQKSEAKIFPHIQLPLKERINLSKIELVDYLKLFDTPKTQKDLEQIGLWGAKVAVMEVPSEYEEILKDSSTGTICYSYPVSSDIFDMRIELPVEFEKKDGLHVSIGIDPKYLVLEREEREKLSCIKNIFLHVKPKNKELNTFADLLKRGNLPDNDRVVPNWLKIKNRQFDGVDFSNNSVDALIELSSEEFNEFVSTVDSDMLFVYLSTLSEHELEKFYRYNDDVVKLAEGAKQTSKEQFEQNLQKVKESWQIEDIAKQRATLELPLALNHAKNLYHKTLEFEKFIRAKYYAYKEDDLAIRYEGTLSKLIYNDAMKFIPNYFEQVITHFQDFYNPSEEEHQKIAKHLAKRFGLLINSLEYILRIEGEKQTSLAWFIQSFQEQIKEVDGYEILKSDELVFHLMNTYASIIHQDDESYIASLISVVERLFDWYPLNHEACEYALSELMKSVALKPMSVKNANRFISFFEELPRFYTKLSYERIMSLKELVNETLREHKPLENEIFAHEGVKNRLIVLNYLLDMEDLYYESGEDKDA